MVEYAVIEGDKLIRKPKSVLRAFLVDCPVHGKVPYEIMGHHISAKSKKQTPRGNAPQITLDELAQRLEREYNIKIARHCLSHLVQKFYAERAARADRYILTLHSKIQ